MSTWDEEIFTVDTNTDFLDELVDLDFEEIFEAVRDAVLLAAKQDAPSEDELLNGQAAATIAAIWAGAPFSAGEIAENYPFIRRRPDEMDEQLVESAAVVLEEADTDQDLEQFLEALA
ncbi:hypothetical protein GC584_10265 [Corynebacterium sp. zg912]|uniref:DUF4259 domain-containing protein n=1 Tax=Corynebacterium wankanglinii TaxID=2735136 RepID=A0A7H0KB76_9CORY|nr:MULTISPECIES: DUF4259 domain-containing protein [Corynebacterium]MBA1834550.1 hypothetical protein [Corynebacterium wankanglinii]MBA1838293.1 hypothetical protein [Corynebacterium wankanglinii]MCR5929777.1 hypothetical protein [Corynebacterium sp. zg912]QNP94542.1 hypothetical protein IA203_03150 [Corynebacterium wankanglinii]